MYPGVCMNVWSQPKMQWKAFMGKSVQTLGHSLLVKELWCWILPSKVVVGGSKKGRRARGGVQILHTSSTLHTNRCMKWACGLDCQFWTSTDIVGSSLPYSNVGKLAASCRARPDNWKLFRGLVSCSGTRACGLEEAGITPATLWSVDEILTLPRRLHFHPCPFGYGGRMGYIGQERIHIILGWIRARGQIQEFLITFFKIVKLGAFFYIFFHILPRE